MSKSRLIVATNNNNEGHVIIDWTQVPNDKIRYNTDDEEEWEEQAWLEAKRVEREKAKAEKAAWEAEEERACKEEEKKDSEAGGEVKKVVMDPGCTHCTQAKAVCEFLVDGNKKQVACIWCNQSKGKCWWPGDGKDTKASPKARRVDKGKKWKADKENTKAGPSKQKQAKTSVRLTEVLDLDEPKAGWEQAEGGHLFELHETVVENSGQITNALELLLDKSYGYGMLVTPPDLDSSEFNSDELHEEAKWLKAHSKDEEEGTKGEDETMAKAK
ncbi:hypothetical protein M404DRAFT_32968 [Pisolithus tinctorius Marx 270]|uniref:Uncharacterized protein n=1 Tax=Pisolithus tinctorius Marx 270 TaxID=870435 RepID=A0A0C3N6P6_PISTI|nr:hypothetical protein M404DRAFT_32968 [Pisolithus tinctorius Marx 270]